MTSFQAKLLWDNISRGDLSAVHTLLESGNVNLEERDPNGCTFLMVACEQGAINIVRELLQAGVDPNAVDNGNWNALLCASREGHLEIVMELLEMNVDLEHADMCGWTALMWACYKGHTLVVTELLDKGANPNVKADHHMTCLSWAAGRGHTEVVKLLIDRGAKINMPDKYGTTSLIWACRKGHLEIVDALLGEGATVDASGMNSWTPLLVATKGGHFDVVHSVLSQDPNVNATDKDGLTALAIAAKEGYTEIVNDLLRRGAYVNLSDRNGDSILIHAVKGGYIEIVKALLKKYVDVDTPGHESKTALYCAVEKGFTDIVKLLLNSNPNLELRTKDDDTPLLRAVRMRNEECVRMFLDKGAKVSASDKRGDTALHIAIRARAKRITELLLSNPRNSRLLYRLNKAGESPYSMDTYHARGILPQIYGHGKLNATDAENLLGYEIYSSALADILSEPSLITPITMGLYAKWGSGKSFLLDKLRLEMRSFTQQNSQAELSWSWLTVYLFVLVDSIVGEILGLTLGWRVGLAVGLGLLPVQFALMGLIILLTNRYDFSVVTRLGCFLARRQKMLSLFLKMLYCVPKLRPVTEKHSMASNIAVRFLFSDCTRLTSVGGEKSLAAMIGTLCEAMEKEYGVLIARLFRVFKPTPGRSKSSRFKSICCIPYFIITTAVLVCILVAIADGILEGVHKDNAVFIVLVSLIGLAFISNLRTWGQMLVALVMSQKRRVIRAAVNIDELKMDGFMQQLKREVDLMSSMVNCLDSFTPDQTRLVVIVDGLDSCEQDKVLQVLDTVKSLFSDEGSPFIVILAVDPHIIIKGIEQNLRNSLQDTNVNGFDYLRNVVHLPFYLQSQGMRIQQVEAISHHPSVVDSPNRTTRGSQDGKIQDSSISAERPKKASRNLSTSMAGVSLSGSVPGMMYASSFDLTSTISKNDYFSDINPRSMRRLMNIVAVTARLLRAYNIDFKWHRLAAWINLTEQWPYRLSWIIYYFEEVEVIENSASLNSLYRRILPRIPATKDQDPLLEIDRNVRKLEASLTSKSGNFPLLNVADLKRFLPCTINLDPYLRKLIRENQHNMERHQAEMASLGGVFSPPPGPPPSSLHATRLKEPVLPDRSMLQASPVRYNTGLSHPHLLYNMYAGQPQMPYAAAFAAAAMQQGQMQPFAPGVVGMRPPGVDPRRMTESTVKHPREFFSNYTRAVSLSRCSVKEVCDLLSRLRGLSQAYVPEYQAKVRDNNISGLVLAMCDLSELQPVLGMRFGDWQIFRSAVVSLLHHENECVPSTPGEVVSPASHTVDKSGKPPKPAQHSSNSYSSTSSSASPSRSVSASAAPRTRDKFELQKIQERKFKRNDSIVQQLSYETAILKSAVSEFVDEESDEEEEEEEEEEVEGDGLEKEGRLDAGGSPYSEGRAQFQFGSDCDVSNPDILLSSQFNVEGDRFKYTPSNTEDLKNFQRGETRSRLDEVVELSDVAVVSSDSMPLSSVSSHLPARHDVSSFIQVLDGPKRNVGCSSSGESVPLLGSIQLHSTSSSSVLDVEPVSIFQHSNLSQIPENGVGTNTSWANVEDTYPTTHVIQQLGTCPLHTPDATVPGSPCRQCGSLHCSTGHSVGKSLPDPFQFPAVDVPHRPKPRLTDISDSAPDLNYDFAPGSQEKLTSSTEHLPRPLLGSLPRQQHYSEQNSSDASQGASPKTPNASSTATPHPAHPGTLLQHDSFQRSFSTVVDMSSPPAPGQTDFHQQLSMRFASLEELGESPSGRTSPDRETVV